MVTRSTKPRSQGKPRASSPAARKRAFKAPIPPKRRPGEELHEYLVRLGNWVPKEAWEGVPRDLAANFHHYAHGGPKQDP
jgi:hypothetical protein